MSPHYPPPVSTPPSGLICQWECRKHLLSDESSTGYSWHRNTLYTASGVGTWHLHLYPTATSGSYLHRQNGAGSHMRGCLRPNTSFQEKPHTRNAGNFSPAWLDCRDSQLCWERNSYASETDSQYGYHNPSDILQVLWRYKPCGFWALWTEECQDIFHPDRCSPVHYKFK